jgi:hypothetical protein
MEKPPKKLLEQVRDIIRLKHYSYKTEKSYVNWIKRYILFHNISELRTPNSELTSMCLIVVVNVLEVLLIPKKLQLREFNTKEYNYSSNEDDFKEET